MHGLRSLDHDNATNNDSVVGDHNGTPDNDHDYTADNDDNRAGGCRSTGYYDLT